MLCFVRGSEGHGGRRTGTATRQRGVQGASEEGAVSQPCVGEGEMRRDMVSRHTHWRDLQLDHLSSARRLHAPPPRSLC